MKCNQTKCQWNIDYGCMKPMWMECTLSNVKMPEAPVEEPLEAKLERVMAEAKRATRAGNNGKKHKRRVNPHRKPMSRALMKKMQDTITGESINLAMALFLTVLLDKFGYEAEELKAVWDEVNDLSDSVAKGYVNINDLLEVLSSEYDIEIAV